MGHQSVQRWTCHDLLLPEIMGVSNEDRETLYISFGSSDASLAQLRHEAQPYLFHNIFAGNYVAEHRMRQV